MADQSILFSGPMIRALLAGRKTQTRRLAAPRWAPRARVWVREAHYLTDDGDFEQAVYAADTQAVASHLAVVAGLISRHPEADWSRHKKLRPSIHMPRWASRLTLEITEVRQELLRDISEADAEAEGTKEPSLVPLVGAAWSERDMYAKLWDHINGPGSWAANPLVWVTSFAVVNQNIDA